MVPSKVAGAQRKYQATGKKSDQRSDLETSAEQQANCKYGDQSNDLSKALIHKDQQSRQLQLWWQEVTPASVCKCLQVHTCKCAWQGKPLRPPQIIETAGCIGLRLTLPILHMAKCNLGQVTSSQCVQQSFQQICIRGGHRGLPCHMLTDQPHLAPPFALSSLQVFSIASLANSLPYPFHPCWKSGQGKYCVLTVLPWDSAGQWLQAGLVCTHTVAMETFLLCLIYWWWI